MGNRRKILFLIESLSGGGAEKVLSTIVRHIDKKRFAVTVCAIVNTGPYVNEIKSLVSYSYIIPNPDECKTRWQKLRYKLRYQLVYSLLPLSLVYKLFLPKGNDVEIAFIEGFTTKLLSKASSKSKKIAWVHTDLINNHWISSIYRNKKEERKSYTEFDTIIGVSETVANAVRALYGDTLNIKTIHNPIDTEEIIGKSHQFINIPQKKEGVTRICSVGRLVPQKAFDRLLRIVNRLHNENYNIELWLLGDGPLKPEYEKYISENALSGIVTLWGFKPNPYPYLANSDIFVCASISEGYSTAATEALILGKPIVTTDCSGMKELLRNDSGIITDNNEESLYLGLKNVLDNPSVIEHFRAMASARSQHYSTLTSITPIESTLS